MAAFMTELWESIFTPGPTSSLVTATNASFAALQIILAGLLLATQSIHFVVLSVLCAGLWFGINWFVRELEAEAAKEREQTQDAASAETSAVETTKSRRRRTVEPVADADGGQLSVKRHSGNLSTDSEWDKLDEGNHP